MRLDMIAIFASFFKKTIGSVNMTHIKLGCRFLKNDKKDWFVSFVQLVPETVSKNGL